MADNKDDDDDERYGDIIPPRSKLTRMYDPRRSLTQDAHLVQPGWGLGNLVATMRNRSAARLADARTANVEAWTRFLQALNNLGYRMMERERVRRRLDNLDEILDAEEAHEDTIIGYERQIAIKEVQKRLRDAERALERVDGNQEPKERQKQDPLGRLKGSISEQKRVKREGEELIREMMAEARASGLSDDDPELRREIENVREEVKRILASIRERG